MAELNLIYLPFGILPSLIWLLFYLREDVRPEPKREVIRVFLLGMVFAFLLAGAIYVLNPYYDLLAERVFKISLPLQTPIFLKILLLAAVEEITKYLPIKLRVLRSPELDEPVDILIYMIISGLGFAASENFLLALGEKSYFSILLGRFLTATFLHALSSGIFGFFLAFSFFSGKKIYFFLGFSIATLLHGLHNFFIMEREIKFLALTLIFSAILLKILFERSKKIKSICKI